MCIMYMMPGPSSDGEFNTLELAVTAPCHSAAEASCFLPRAFGRLFDCLANCLANKVRSGFSKQRLILLRPRLCTA
jgi:hypothetical protein